MRTFGTLFVAGITGAAILKILAALLAPLWASLAAIIAGWLAALGSMMLGWALMGLKVGLLVLAVVLVVKWLRKRSDAGEAA
jgi:hypothetical protein